MRPVLEGIKVVDWGVFQVGPMAAAYLADLGADVIHVETPGEGDLMRGIVSSLGVSPVLPKGRHAHFEEHNRNKRGIAIDLKTPEGKEIMYRLIANADVFVTNLRPKARLKLGMDYATLSRHNPKIIYASATGLGEEGPFGDLPSLDPVAQAWSGAMLAGVPKGAEPCWGTPNVSDRGTSLQLAYAILAALRGRDLYGEGQEIQVSQLGAMVNLQGYYIMLPLLVGEAVAMRERAIQRNPLYNFYKCKDETWIVLVGFTEGTWPKLCSALNLSDDVANDSRFQDIPSREANCAELIALLDKIFATKTRSEWVEVLKGSDVLFAPVHDLNDVVDDPQVLANDYITEWDHPVLGKIKFVGQGVKFSKTKLDFNRPAPELGEHNEEVLLELGYDWQDIARFQEVGVFG